MLYTNPIDGLPEFQSNLTKKILPQFDVELPFLKPECTNSAVCVVYL